MKIHYNHKCISFIQVAGVVSYIPTRRKDAPNFFASVKFHKKWIREAMDYLSWKPHGRTATFVSGSNPNITTISSDENNENRQNYSSHERELKRTRRSGTAE